MEQSTFIRPSKNPLEAIAKVAYDGQDPKNMQYKEGYEYFMSIMPDMSDTSSHLTDDIEISSLVMGGLAKDILKTDWHKQAVPDNTFERHILGIEESDNGEGREIVVAMWGDSFSSTVHGHAAGFLYEELLHGKMLVNTYRLIIPDMNLVKLVSSEMYDGNTVIASSYTKDNPDNFFKRQALIHNFKSIGFSSSLHYVPEHTRDGRDNGFKVKWFDDVMPLTKDDVTQITSKEGMYLRKGDVALVQSQNVPEYGTHYIVITGAPVLKPHGLRPRDTAMVAPTNKLVDEFEFKTGLKLLKLNKDAKERYLNFHKITIENGEVVFPKA